MPICWHVLQDFSFIGSERIPRPLLAWISSMLSGAIRLTNATLGVEMLELLPLPRRKALKSLHLDASIRQAEAGPEILKAVLECSQLETLSINCRPPGWVLPELDPQHLAHLRKCTLDNLPAPGNLKLSCGKGQLYTKVGGLAAWINLRQQWRDCLYLMNVDSRSGRVLRAWPKGIAAFLSLQFLQLMCDNMVPSTSDNILDLAHFAHIPHVSLNSMHRLTAKISTGSWKVLELKSRRAFSVAIRDVEAFIKSTGVFFFEFPSASGKKPHNLIERVKRSGTDIGKNIFEYRDEGKSLRSRVEAAANNNEPMLILSNYKRSYLGEFSRAHAEYKREVIQK